MIIYRRFYLVLLLAFLGVFLSCQQSDKPQDYYHPYFDTVFSRVARLPDDQTLRYVEAAYHSFPHAGVRDVYRKYSFLSQFFMSYPRERYDLAYKYADSAETLILLSPDKGLLQRELAYAFVLKGNIYVYSGRYKTSFPYFMKARSIAETIKDTCLFISYTWMLTGVCNDQRKYREAAAYAKQAISDGEYCKDPPLTLWARTNQLNDVGVYYNRAEMPDSALHYFKRALHLLSEHKKGGWDSTDAISRNGMLGVVYGNMGSAIIQKGDTPAAELLFKKSVAITGKPVYKPGDAQLTWLKLARLYLSQGRFPEAGSTLQLLRSSLDSITNLQTESDWYQLQVQYLYGIGQYKQAADYLPVYLKFRDSIALKRPDLNIDIEEEYLDFKQESDFKLLQEKRRVQNLYLILVSCGSLAAVAIALYVLWSLRRLRRLNATITTQNVQLENTLSALEQSYEHNKKLISIVSHDLRSPIGGITTLVEAMINESGRSKEDLYLLSLMQDTGKRAIELVDSLLQIDPRIKEASKSPSNLEDLLRSTVTFLQHKAEAKSQRLSLSTEPATANVNTGSIWRVMTNLIANAIKFSPEHTEILIRLSRDANLIYIMVQDQGIGIPDSFGDRIFDMFTDFRRKGTSGEQTFGLGLAISRQIIEAHGGRIWYDSVMGSGTTFYVDLPVNM